MPVRSIFVGQGGLSLRQSVSEAVPVPVHNTENGAAGQEKVADGGYSTERDRHEPVAGRFFQTHRECISYSIGGDHMDDGELS